MVEVLFPYSWLAANTEGKDLTRATGLYRTSADSESSDSDGERADATSGLADKDSRQQRSAGRQRGSRSQRAAGDTAGVQQLGQTVVQPLSADSVLRARIKRGPGSIGGQLGSAL